MQINIITFYKREENINRRNNKLNINQIKIIMGIFESIRKNVFVKKLIKHLLPPYFFVLFDLGRDDQIQLVLREISHAQPYISQPLKAKQ